MRVLVTGGLGFIGSHVAEGLATAGHEVVVLDAKPGRDVVADVRDQASVERALHGVDAVSHQAAKVGYGTGTGDLPAYAGNNDLGTASLLAAMANAGVRSLVLASSMVVYGEGAYRCPRHGTVRPQPRRSADLAAGRFDPPCPRCGSPLEPELIGEDAPLDPRNGYAASKVAQEHYAAVWSRATGGRVVALRYHNVYGPRMPRDTPYAGVAAVFRSALRRGEPPRVFEDGRQRRDFVHVRDVAAANVAAVRAAAGDGCPPGEVRPYNVGSGEPRTIGEVASCLSSVLDGPPPTVTGEYRLGDVRHITASSARISLELGWKAAVPFTAGVAELAFEGAL